MIQPNELKLHLPMDHATGTTTTTRVWEILKASYNGDLEKVKRMAGEDRGLTYAQYNYTPPIHFAVREGHAAIVQFLLDNGALAPDYRIYPFLDNLVTIAEDRNLDVIAAMLRDYLSDPSRCKFKGDNGKIYYNRSTLQEEFEDAVDKGHIKRAEEILKDNPEFALDETFFWGEGILMRPAKTGDKKLLELLMRYGATVPRLLKWAQFYYFETYDHAVFLMENGMDPDVMSWHHVTLLHDMAQKGYLDKAELLLNYGAGIDAIEEEYQSTPLGMAARWGHKDMVELLLQRGADVNRSGAAWSTPLAWAKKKGHKEIETILIEAGAR